MFSIIIPAKNEEDNIQRCIKSVQHSSVDNNALEIIVVDNGSDDLTVQKADEAGAKVFILRDKNISGLRNYGAIKATYPILIFLDADCAVLPGWLEAAQNILDKEKIGIAGEFPLIPRDNNAGWIEKTMYGCTPRIEREVQYIGSCNMIMKKKLFFQIGQFDENAITGEDYILCTKVREQGLRVLASPELAVIHYGFPHDLSSYFRREIWHGLGMLRLHKAGKLTLPLLWSITNIIILLIVIISMLGGYYPLLTGSILIFFLLPAGATIQRMYRMQSVKHMFKMYFLFLLYGIARTLAVIMIAKSYFTKRGAVGV